MIKKYCDLCSIEVDSLNTTEFGDICSDCKKKIKLYCKELDDKLKLYVKELKKRIVC